MASIPEGQHCGTCRYVGNLSGTDALFMCLRNPPTVVEIQGGEVITRFPRVNSTQWCGEHTPANPQTIDEGAVTMARFVLLGDKTAARALADKLKEE